MAEAMYRQIAEDLRSKIESGEIAPGSQLPTEIVLMDEYDASRNTVRDSIKLLITRGLVETRPGQGTYVVERINPFVTTLTSESPAEGRGGGEGGVYRAGEQGLYFAEVQSFGREGTASQVRVEIQLAHEVLADALRLEEGAQVVSRHQQRFIDGTPWSLETSFYPMTLVDRGAIRLLQASDIEEGAVAYLAEECGIKQAGYRDSISVRVPDENETSFFRLPADGRVPVFVVFRVGFDQNGERFRLTVTVYPADRNRFVVKVGEVPSRTAQE
jgi:GntR family transcriptional regulator